MRFTARKVLTSVSFGIFHLFSSLLSSTSQVLTIPSLHFLPFSLSITCPPTPLFAAVSQLILAPGLPRPVCLGLLRLLGLLVGLLISCAVCSKRQLVSKFDRRPGPLCVVSFERSLRHNHTTKLIFELC